MVKMEDFFTSVLPPEGPYVLGYPNEKKIWTIKAFHSFLECRRAALSWANSGYDVFYCIGSIKDLNHQTKDRFGKVKKSLKTKENIAQIKSLIVDIDIGPEKNKYQTKQAALKGLIEFVKNTGLPEPTVVSSGYGFHVYWPLREAVGREEWEQLAQALKAAFILFDEKLIADKSRICDCSSFLRVPETFNFKNAGAPKPVQTMVLTGSRVYEDYERILEAFKKKAFSPEEKEDILQKHDYHVVTEKCNWLKNYLQNIATTTEPEWYSVLGTASYLDINGKTADDIAHLLSEGHPAYSAVETSKKFSQVRKNQSGPTRCSRFMDLRPEWCHGCPYKELVTTPVRLDCVDGPATAPTLFHEVYTDNGEVLKESTTLPSPPFPYFRGKENGGIYRTIEDGYGGTTAKKIYEYDIFPTRRLKDEETGSELLEISLTLPRDGQQYIKIPSALLADPRKMATALAEKGVIVQHNEVNNLAHYIIEYAKVIQKQEKAQEEFARFGWRDFDTDNPRFVLGEHVIDKEGKIRRANLATHLQQYSKAISVAGDFNEWKKAFNVFANIEGSEPQIFGLLLSLATPLLQFTPLKGMIYNLQGPSGIGKSAVLKLLTSVWGKPNESHIQVHDNRIPMFNTLGYFQSIPVSFDESTQIASDTLADTAYSISEGRGKHRADKTGNTRVNTTHWRTIVCSTSNVSLYEKLGMSRSGNNAHAYRIFEANVGPALEQNRPLIDGALTIIENNYGHACRIFMAYVMQNMKAIKKTIAETTAHFAKQYNMPTAERYFYTIFAIVTVAGAIAKKLGISEYDVTKVVAWAINYIESVRRAVQSVTGDAVSVFSHFLQAHIRSTLTVKEGKNNLLGMDTQLFSLAVRLEYNRDNAPWRGYVSIQAVKQFAKANQIEYAWLVKGLQDVGLIVGFADKKMGEGTALMLGTTKCWEIDLQHKSMASAFEAHMSSVLMPKQEEARVH
jgi:hypothetical protein